MRKTWIVLLVALAAACNVEKKPDAVAVAKPAAVRAHGPCSWLTESEATTLLGQRMAVQSEKTDGECVMIPKGPTGDTALTIAFKVDDDTKSYNAFVQRDDASMIAGVGDRAVWNTQGHSVIVVKGGKRLFLRVDDAKTPPQLTESDLQQKAVTLAEKIVPKM